jgi:hypothetical protein
VAANYANNRKMKDLPSYLALIGANRGKNYFSSSRLCAFA